MVVHLYWISGSQPSRAVYMTIRTLGIEHELHTVDLLNGEHKKPAYLKINPQGKVPAIVDGDLRLGESRAIMCYLCNKYANGLKKNLYPTDPVQRAKVDQMLYVGEGFEAAIMQQYPAPAKILFRGEGLDESKRPIAEKALDEVESYLKDSAYIAGENLTIADFSIYFYMTNLDILPTAWDYSAWPNISKWRENIQALPNHDVCNNAGQAMLKAFMDNALNPPVKFYHYFVSPFSRAVHMVLKALEIPFELNVVDLFKQEQKKEEYLKINPRGLVPAVKVKDFCISESRAIAAFLCNKYADETHKHLYPEDPIERGKIDMLLYIGEAAFDELNKWMGVFPYIFGDGMPNEDSSGFDKAMAGLESRVEGKFLTGDNVTIADICMYVPISLSTVAAQYDLSPYPKLKAVFENMKALPYHDEVNEAANNTIKDKVKDKVAKLSKNKQATGF